MKFTLSWLKDHIETNAPLDQIVATLTKIGLEVEHVDDKALALKDFVIARVVEAKPHPNAGRLRVCLVDAGGGALVQVVCGAPNARAGMKSVFAAPGAYIPASRSRSARALSAASNRTACCVRAPNSNCPKTMTAFSSCRTRPLSARLMRNGHRSMTRSSRSISAQPPRRHGHQRNCPRPRGGGAR